MMRLEHTEATNIQRMIADATARMVDGEITEDEFKEEVEKINNVYKGKGLAKHYEEKEQEKKEDSYKDYFKNNRQEFKNILGI
ncbi:MAG: hypothetical protein ACRC5M_04715 [Anaeroplasmataceae bacterium]